MEWSALTISLKISLLATAMTFALGILAARFVVRLRRFQGVIDGVFTLPMILPPTVVGFFLLVAFGKNSLPGQLLAAVDASVIFTWVGAVIASATVAFPLMYRTVRGALEEVDGDMLNAARTLGMGETRIFWRVVAPNILPSIIAGTILSFARALGEFGATMMIAGNIPGRTQTMAVAVYTAVQTGDRALAYRWVVVICAISFAAMVLMNLVNRLHGRSNPRRGGL